MVSAIIDSDVGDHESEQERRPADRREQQPVEVAALDVGDERGRPRDPVTAKTIADRQLERLEVETAAIDSVTSCSAPTFTT